MGAIERRQRILQHRRVGLAARLDPLADHHAEDEQHAGDDRAAEEQKEDLAVVELDLDLLAPPLDVLVDVFERGSIHAGHCSVSQAHESSSFVVLAMVSGAETPRRSSPVRITWAMASTQ